MRGRGVMAIEQSSIQIQNYELDDQLSRSR